MRRETIYTLHSLYRGEYNIDAFTFGDGDHTVDPDMSIAVLGSLRGNEIQQLFIASQLVRYLRKLEDAGAIVPGAEIKVIPCGNPYSLNTGSRFWAVDNTDINRMFPGYDQGETTQRIADGLFKELRGFGYGVQLTSFYLPGEFVPHARIIDTGLQGTSIARLFGLPYAVIRDPEPVDSGTLDYNWQIFETKAVSIFARETDTINAESGNMVMLSIVRFMTRLGLIKCDLHGGFLTTVVKEDHLVPVISANGGLLRRRVVPGDHVEAGHVLGEIYEPYTGERVCTLVAPVNGVVFFSHRGPLVTQNAIVYRIINDASFS